ncbi:hypothetical protein D3C84_280840 [compost metagenome]
MSSGNNAVAFACSLQKKIIPKIKKDLQKIIDVGGFSKLVYFCEEDIPVAKRQKLDEYAKTLGIILQIFDGSAIADMLSDRDTFWIAQQYLKISSDQMPRSCDDPDWYAALIIKWKNSTPLIFSQADFYEIQLGIRYTTFDHHTRQDLNFWLSHIRHYLVKTIPRNIQRVAEYEIVVATYRGKGIFDDLYDLVEDYYSDFDDYLSSGDLEDAVTLLIYIYSAYVRGIHHESAEYIFNLKRKITTLLEENLTIAPGPGRSSDLLRLLGNLQSVPDSDEDIPDIKRSADYWLRMLEQAKKTPLFPIERFNSYLTKIFSCHENYSELACLTTEVDELLATRVGSKTAGKNAESRGDRYLEHGDILPALKEFHHARVRLFTGDSKAEVLGVVLKISECYRQLGLAYAAKYYALSAAWFSLMEQDQKNKLPFCLLTAANTEYTAGNFLGFSHLLFLGIVANIIHMPDPFDIKKHPLLLDNILQLQALLGLLKRTNPDSFKQIESNFSNWPEELGCPYKNCDYLEAFWNIEPVNDLLRNLSDDLIDHPWGDISFTRNVRWTALGINWNCSFENTHESTVNAEQFISQSQLVLATLAVENIDLVLVPVKINIIFSIANDLSKMEIYSPKIENGEWIIQINSPVSYSEDFDQKQIVIEFLSTILRPFSLLNDHDYMELTKKHFKSTIEVSFNFRSFREVFLEFTPNDSFIKTARENPQAIYECTDFNSQKFNFIKKRSGLSPNYNHQKSINRIADRYSAAIPFIRFTVKKLMANKNIFETLKTLHDDGMKDWYILSLIYSRAMEKRITIPEHLPSEMKNKLFMDSAIKIRGFVETHDSALSHEIFDPDMLSIYEHAYFPLLLIAFDLNSNFDLCQDPALLDILKERYNLCVDDVEHEDIFSWH